MSMAYFAIEQKYVDKQKATIAKPPAYPALAIGEKTAIGHLRDLIRLLMGSTFASV